MANCDDFYSPEEVMIKEEPEETTEEYSLPVIVNTKREMDDCDNFNSFEFKLEQEELIIKEEPEEEYNWIGSINHINSKLQVKVEHGDHLIDHDYAKQQRNKSGRGFSKNVDFKMHKEVHLLKCVFKCPNCKKCFDEKIGLKTHMMIHKNKKDLIQIGSFKKLLCKKPFQCQQCGKIFTAKSSLKLHKVVHDSDEPFKCQYCDRSFKRKSTLQQHMMVHRGIKPYNCQHCDKGFTHTAYLRNHNLRHK